MSEFSTAWKLSRQRLVDEVTGLNDEQLRWKLHPEALSIGQMALHVAGVEISFASQLLDRQLGPRESKLKSAATEGVVNDQPFPFDQAEVSSASVAESFEAARSMLEPLITSPSAEVLAKQIKSALGPIITGEGAFARLAFHPAYHQGQAYLIKTSPGFPS